MVAAVTVRCEGCDARLDEDAAYCQRCGRATTDAIGAGDGLSSSAVTSSVSHETLDRRWLYALAGAVVVALAGWGLVGLVGSDASPGPADPADGDGATVDGEDGIAASEAARDRPVDEALVESGAIEAKIPVTGSETGLSVIISDGTSSELVDLDTGIVYDIPLSGYPALVTGDWLVTVGARSTEAVPLTSLGDEPRRFSYGFDSTASVWPADHGKVWFGSFAATETTFELIDLATGSVEASRSGPTVSMFAPWGVAGPHHSTSASGGVWRRDENGFELVTDGQIVAANSEIALVAECTAPTVCDQRWFDARTWEERDLVTPDSVPEGGSQITGDRVLIYWDGDSVKSLDLRRGTALRASVSTISWTPLGSGLGLSPDGRLLGIPNHEAGSASILDLDSNERFDLGRSRGDAMLFIESDRLGLPG